MPMGKRLSVWTGGASVSENVKFLPEHALYSPPNPDGSRKMCQNCVFWKASDNQCFLHEADIVTTPLAVCGYHVFGTPSSGGDGELLRLSPENLQAVTPAQSGLVSTESGSSCDCCTFYQPSGALQGTCEALTDPDQLESHPIVEALGCCTRWEQRV